MYVYVRVCVVRMCVSVCSGVRACVFWCVRAWIQACIRYIGDIANKYDVNR